MGKFLLKIPRSGCRSGWLSKIQWWLPCPNLHLW